MRILLTLLLMIVLSGCADLAPDPAQIPSGLVEANGPPAVGPITVVGSGQTQGIGWRYSVYESADGMCTQLESMNGGGTGCGHTLPGLPDQVFASVGSGSSGDGPSTAEGVVAMEVDQVWIQDTEGRRHPTTLMTLEDAGVDGQAFVGFVPAGVALDSVLALDQRGELMERMELAP